MFSFIKRCPYCKERIKRGAILCKHCRSSLGGNGNASARANDGGLRYLQNGFRKINDECDDIEGRIQLRTGFIFVKHQYSSDDLLEATGRIESFIEKMRDDLEEWETANKMTDQIKSLFNRKAEEVYQRLEHLHSEIERREPTWWEKVRSAFKRIIEKLFSFFSFKLVAGKKNPKTITA